MELETLEVLLEINTKNVQESINKVLPQINSMMKKIENVTGQSGNKIEQNMDIDDATKKMDKSLGQFVTDFSKQMDRLENISKTKTTNLNRTMESGFKQTRTKAGKEVDLMVKDIEAKVGQARAAQARIAQLSSQRSAAINSGDEGNVIKYDSQIARAQQQMTSYQNKAQEMGRAIKREFDAIPQSLNNISATMDQNEKQIETLRMKIANMQKVYQSQRQTTGNFDTGFGTKDSSKSIDTMQKIQVQSAKMNKLISSNDQLQRAYATTEDRAKTLRSALDRLGNTLDNSSIKTGNASMGMQTVARQSNQARSAWSRFGGLFNRVSNNIAHGTGSLTSRFAGFFSFFNRANNTMSRSVSKGGNQFNRYAMSIRKTLWMLGNQLIIFTLLYRGIMALGTGLMNSLKTNEQFASSLNQIKVNLLTAFYPIYTAALPAINALMSALARVTGYIAQFVAAIFGTTYEAAKEGASGLYDNVKALEETGSGASKAKEKLDKLKSSLMGFDEINRIGLDVGKEDESGNGDPNRVDFGTPNYQTPAWLTKLADDVKNVFSKFFQPFQAAWDQYGQGVVDSFKFALTEIWELAKSIGRAFMEVWTDGTGERILGNILQILTNIFTSIGNVANGLREAWESNDVGVSIMRSILGIIEDLTVHFLNMAEATEEWTRNLDFTPLMTSIDKLLKAVRPLADKIGGGLEWFYINVLLPLGKWTIEDALPAFLGVVSGALEVLDSIIEAMKPTFQWLWDEFLQPIAEWTGGVIVKVLEDLGDALSDLSDWIDENQETVSNFIVGIGVFAGTLAIIAGVSKAIGVITGVVAAIKAGGGVVGILGLLGKGIGGIIATLGGPWAIAIAIAVTAGVLLWKNWDTVKEKAGKLKDWISDKWTNIKDKTSETWSKVKESVKKESEESRKRATDNIDRLKISVSSSWDNIKTKTSDTWSNLSTTVRDKASNAHKWGSDKIKTLKSDVSTRWNELKSDTATKWGNISSDVSKKANTAKDNAITAFSNMKTRVTEYTDQIKTSTGKAFDKVAGWASDLGDRISDGLKNGLDAVKTAAASIGNGIVGVIGKAMNGVIKGINWVLDKVGAGKKKLSEWKIPTYAQGTGNHPGGPAIVNDAPGQHYQEAYQLPNGQRGLFPKTRNMLVNLPKGAKVLNGKATSAMYGNVPRYANGIGNWFSKTWNGAKKMAGTVWDYVTNPSKLLDVAISKFVNLGKTMEPGLSMAKGAISTVAGSATSFIKDFLTKGAPESASASLAGSLSGSSMATPSGSGVQRWRSTVIRALSMNGLPTTEAYVSAWLRQIQTESGGNEKAVQSTAVKDINYYTGNLARGLVQVIPPTFNAYAFPGYNNPFNGLHSLLAGMNYAKNRYGKTGMLNAVGKGIGYENGGMVSKEGYYRLAEGNKKEMVIPLERKNRALELIEVAKDYLGVGNDGTMQMPELFLESPQQRISSPTLSVDAGGGISNMNASISSALAAFAQNNRNAGTAPVTLQFVANSRVIGQLVIDDINELIDRTGTIPINI